MEVAIKRWGNSQGIRIPKEFIEALNISFDTPLNMEVEDERIVISKSFRHKSLEERVKESGKPLKFSKEINWGTPVGNEVW